MEPHVIGKGTRPSRVLSRRKTLQALPPNAIEIDGEIFAPHENGGGLVAVTAIVEASVYVGPDARVRGYAELRGKVRLTHHAVVEGNAKLSGDCVLRNEARASEDCELTGRVVLVKHAHIGGSARLFGPLYIGYFAYIGEDSKIIGDLMIE
jgi:UDP-3-O-[3-hydroxymyristoyl] glucosamine N-acyltransferase